MFYLRDMMQAANDLEYEFIYFSSERRLDNTGMIDIFYETKYSSSLDELTISSIIMRCRVLSGINQKIARERVRKMWYSINRYFEQNKVDMVLALPVDNYVLDIIFRIASMKDVPAFQPRTTPFEDVVRITNSTDHPRLRCVSTEEAEGRLENLKKSFKAHYQNRSKKSKKQILVRYIRELLKKPIFEIWKLSHKDPACFHYNAIFPNENAITVSSIKQLFVNNFMDNDLSAVERFCGNYEKVIFWPLSMSPESAINYLNKDYLLSDYKHLTETVIANLPQKYGLIIKEHPSAYGYRPAHHYDAICNSEHVIFASMDIPTHSLIDASDAVLLTTGGTTGLEAVARGKHVLSLGNCHYKFGNIVRELPDFENFKYWGKHLEFGEVSSEDQLKVVQNYLTNTILNSTWCPGSGKIYQEKIAETIRQCVALAKSGYNPKYFGSTKSN